MQYINGIPVYSNSDYTPEELEAVNQQAELYQPMNQSVLPTQNMPLTPVNPTVLANKVKEQLESNHVFVSTGTLPVIEEMCKLFNHNVNDKGSSYTTTAYVYPAQTGIGKSVSLQVYVSLLEKESSLIIVSKVEEALKYCTYINKLSDDKNYARCYYSVSDKNKNSSLRVDTYHLSKYRCIVITHNMFKNLNLNSKKLDDFKLYNEKQRDLVVIDEKLSYYEKYEISFKQIAKFMNIIDNILKVSTAGEELTQKEINQLRLFMRLINNHMQRCENLVVPEISPTLTITKENFDLLLSKHGLDFMKMIGLIHRLVDSRTKELFTELKEIGNVSNRSYEQKIAENVKKTFDEIKGIYADWFVFYKSNQGNKFFRIENIANKLGPSIVLDATASINEFYKIANRMWGFFGYVPAQQIRQYKNLTIYKAAGYNQSRYNIYNGQKPDKIKETAKMYASYANGVLNHPSDKLLIICHMKFENHLKSQCDDSRIVFTHWGNHVGINDYSNCNKVMIVGWNYLDPIEQISHFYNAVGLVDEAAYFINNDVLETFEMTQLADDLVQGVMRCKARIIATEDSDCDPCEVYLFYQDNDKSKKVFEIFDSQFPQAQIHDWQPKGIAQVSKKTAIERTADDFIQHLSSKEGTHQTYLFADLKKELGTRDSKASYVLRSKYFQDELEKKGYILKPYNGKSKYFILK